MTDNHQIVKAEVVEIEKQDDTMHPLVRAAVNGGTVDPDTLGKLMDLQERYERNQAKKAFDRDMVLLKKHMPSVIMKDSNVDYKSKGGSVRYSFSTLANIIEQVEPHLSQFGFSISWVPTTTDRAVTVKCRLTHQDGHFEETSMSAPHDSSGSKNAIQAIGSTQSYLQRYTASAILGLVSRDQLDADNRQSPSDVIDQDRNLTAIGVLKKEGIELADAQAHLQKDFKNWTLSDLENLKVLIRNHRETRETDAQHDVDAQ